MPLRLRSKPLNVEVVKLPRAKIHVIKDQCKGCGLCIHYCPKGVLKESDEINAIGARPPTVTDGNGCILCGFCTIICPDLAIFVAEEGVEGGAYA